MLDTGKYVQFMEKLFEIRIVGKVNKVSGITNETYFLYHRDLALKTNLTIFDQFSLHKKR